MTHRPYVSEIFSVPCSFRVWISIRRCRRRVWKILVKVLGDGKMGIRWEWMVFVMFLGDSFCWTTWCFIWGILRSGWIFWSPGPSRKLYPTWPDLATRSSWWSTDLLGKISYKRCFFLTPPSSMLGGVKTFRRFSHPNLPLIFPLISMGLSHWSAVENNSDHALIRCFEMIVLWNKQDLDIDWL